MSLKDKSVLITGGARRIGRHLALAVAQAGGNVVIHHGHSPAEAEQTAQDVQALGRRAWVVQADLNDLAQAAALIEHASRLTELYAVVNNASIYEALSPQQTRLADWQRHLDINLTAPFLISQAFAQLPYQGPARRIVNILDWRALRPVEDHFPYTISKAGLAALTRSLAAAYAPHILVTGLALGAILPPSDGGSIEGITDEVPIGRWATLEELGQAILFLLDGPEYVVGEILHLDGGRHLR